VLSGGRNCWLRCAFWWSKLCFLVHITPTGNSSNISHFSRKCLAHFRAYSWRSIFTIPHVRIELWPTLGGAGQNYDNHRIIAIIMSLLFASLSLNAARQHPRQDLSHGAAISFLVKELMG